MITKSVQLTILLLLFYSFWNALAAIQPIMLRRRLSGHLPSHWLTNSVKPIQNLLLTCSCKYPIHRSPHILSLVVSSHPHLSTRPGWTHTGLSTTTTKPEGAWSPDETVVYMLRRVMAGHFYIVCPDNESSSEVDNLKIMWGAADIVEGRPALSRWHPDYKVSSILI
jgi:hypothetical protein